MATPSNRRQFEITRSVGAVTIAITALVSGLFAGQIPPRSAKLNELLPLVARHALGQEDGAVGQLASWTRRDLEDVSNEMRRLARTVNTTSSAAWQSVALEPFGVRSPESFDALLKRTAMLHADVAIFHRTRSGYSLPVDQAMQHPLSSDGRSLGVTTGTFHWEAARRALDMVRPAADKADVLLWYQTSTAILQWWNDYYELEPHLIHARERFPRDPVLLMYDGAVHENLAEPRIQNTEPHAAVAQSSYTSTGPCLRLPCSAAGSTQQKKSWVSSPAVEWRTAQALFEQALKIDPNLSEARVRLARVLALQDQHEAAVTQLKLVTGSSATLPPRLQYFSYLFLGREQWTLGRHREAEIAYQQAAVLYPGAQSPQFGLSQVALQRGDRTLAVAHLSILSKPPASNERNDPWWTYNRIHVPDSIELMKMLIQRLSK